MLSPIRYKDYQVKAIAAILNHPRLVLKANPGRGKTAMALGASKVLLDKGMVTSVVILSHQKGCLAYTPEKINPGFEVAFVAMYAQDLVPLRETWERNRGQGVYVISTGLINQWEKEFKPSSRKRGQSLPGDMEDPLCGISDGSDPLGGRESTFDPLTGEKIETPRGNGENGDSKRATCGQPVDKSSLLPNTLLTTTTTTTTTSTYRESILFSSLARAEFVVLDEIHNYRNPSSSTSQGLRAFLQAYKGSRFLGMTATPFYRSADDVFQIFSYVFPSLLGNYKQYKELYYIVKRKQSQMYRWTVTPTGRKKVLVPWVIEEVIGYKNMNKLKEVIAPYFYEDEGSDFALHVEAHSYALRDEAAYLRIVKGQDMASSTVLKLAGPRSTFNASYNRGETVFATDLAGHTLQMDPADLSVGMSVKRELQGELEDCHVLKVSQGLTESDIVTRLNPLIQYLSTTPEKLASLFSVLDGIAPLHGCVIYAFFRESVDFLADAIAARYGARQVVAIKGGEGDLSSRLSSLGPEDFVVISSVALQSLDFYYDSLVIYEPIMNPGPFEQLIGRITRMNSKYREATFHFIVGKKTIDSYFYARLLFLNGQNVFSSAPDLPALEDFQSINFSTKGASLRLLKDVLLWRKAYGPEAEEGERNDIPVHGTVVRGLPSRASLSRSGSGGPAS